MNDLIDRQSAVDVVIEYVKKLCESIGTPEDNEMYSYGRGLLISIVLNLKHLPPAQRWTPVTEGLPDKDVPVFVYLFDDNPYIAWINCDGEWATEEFMVDPDYLPKAWMPLPEPFGGGDGV